MIADYTPLAEKITVLNRALAQGELYEYMVGEKDYAFVNRYADIPTDPESVFASFIALVEQRNDPSLWRYFEISWFQLSADSQYSWLSLYYLMEYLWYTEKHSPPLNLQTLIPQLEKNIKAQEPALSKNRQWLGHDWENGLWGDVQRVTKNISTRFNLKLDL